MLSKGTRTVALAVLAFAVSGSVPATAGQAWVAEPGTGWVSMGYNRKTGDLRLDADGERFTPAGGRRHDFRYAYVSGEVGLVRNLSLNFTSTYLWGKELFDDPSRNFSHHGFSDQWVGVRYQVQRGNHPLALEVNARLPYLYQNSERWLGVLKHDFTALLHSGHAFRRTGELSAYGGFTYRQGSPANQLRLGASWDLPHHGSLLAALPFRLRVGMDGFVSVGEPTPSEPSDRFSQRPRTATSVNYFTFNKSTWFKPWIALDRDLGPGLSAQFGYGNIGFAGMGRSVHKYNDVFSSLTYSF